MQILRRLKRTFVKEILAEWDEPKPSSTTLSSLVRKLDTEKIIGHDIFGKIPRYFLIWKKESLRKSSVKNLLTNYFSGKPEDLLSYFVKEENLVPGELKNLLEKIVGCRYFPFICSSISAGGERHFFN